MKPFRWDPDKNEHLKLARGILFEEIVLAVEEGGVVFPYDSVKIEFMLQAAWPYSRRLVGYNLADAGRFPACRTARWSALPRLRLCSY